MIAAHLLELVHERPLGVGEPFVIGLRDREGESIRRPDLTDADGLAGVHLLEYALRELDGLQAATEHLGERALDDALESAFEVSEDGHADCSGVGSRVPVRVRRGRAPAGSGTS